MSILDEIRFFCAKTLGVQIENMDIICIGVIILIVIILLHNIIDNGKTKQKSKINKQKNKGFLYMYDADSVRHDITSYADDKVYYKDTDNVIGTYNEDGEIYKDDGTLIGRVYGDKFVYMDRTAEYNYLINRFKDFGYERAKPFVSMIMPAGQYNYTWIEMEHDDTMIFVKGVESLSEKQNAYGACAAYLIALEDELINNNLRRFYKTIQQDCANAIQVNNL